MNQEVHDVIINVCRDYEEHLRNAGFLGGTAVAVAIGLICCNLMQIGAGFVIASEVVYDTKEVPGIADTLMNIIPTNPFQALSEQNLLQLIFFALLLGFALIGLDEKGTPVLNFFRAWTEAWKEITNIVLLFTPYGVFGLMASIVGKYGVSVMPASYQRTVWHFAPGNTASRRRRTGFPGKAGDYALIRLPPVILLI